MGDDVKNIVNKIKTVVKRYGLVIAKFAIPAIIIIVLLAAADYFIKLDESKNKDGDMSSTPYAASQYTGNVTIGDSGKITTSVSAQELWDTMIEEGSNVEKYLNDPEQLLKLMNAESITQFLDTRSNPDADIDWEKINKDVDGKEIQGIIKLKRKLSDGSTPITMTYVAPDTFQKYIDNYNSSGKERDKEKALKHFTMGSTTTTPDPSNPDAVAVTEYYATVASWYQVTDKIEIEPNDLDSEVAEQNKTTYNMTTTNINYQQLVSGYTMPFEYLWSMLVMTEDKDFTMDLADLVYDSKIEITVHDNQTTNTNVDVYTYTRTKRTDTEAKVTATGTKRVNKTTETVRKVKTGSWLGDEGTEDVVGNYTRTQTVTTITNTLDIAVTLADVWMAKFEQAYTHEIPEKIESTSNENLENIEYPDISEPSETKTGNKNNSRAKELLKQAKEELKDEHSLSSASGLINSVTEKIYYKTTNRKEQITNTVESKKYKADAMKVSEKTQKRSDTYTEDNFVTIFLDPNNTKAKNGILSAEEWLFEMLEQNDSTKEMVDLTKYLLYKALDKDYGVTDYDFNALYRKNLTSVGGGDYIVEITRSPNTIVIKDLETLKKAFNGYSRPEKLIEHAQEYLDLQNIYKVNAVFAAAVSISETSAGRAGHATDGKNNWYNIECSCGNILHGRFETYTNAKESIERFYKLIANGSYYFKQGKYTVSEIGMIYCENADAPGGWIENTNAFMTEMFQAAGIDTSAFAGTIGGIKTEEERMNLENYIQNELIHTKHHKDNYAYQNGPFARWWSNPYNVLQPFQCTWWANGRASMYLEQYGKKYKKYPTQNGHGGQYYDKNIAGGWFKYGTTPKPNSLVSWKRGTYGHVAYVEGVTADGKIYISHAGGGDSWYGVQLIDPNNYGSFILNGYIYLDEPI